MKTSMLILMLLIQFAWYSAFLIIAMFLLPIGILFKWACATVEHEKALVKRINELK